MDYEKAYKASLKTAAQWIKDGCTDKEKICLECVFPELRESEDERIIKALETFINQPEIADKITFEARIGWLNWLEKQKEQNECPEFCSGHCVGCEQKEQKPAEVKDPFSNANFVRGYESGYADAKREQKPADNKKVEMTEFEQSVYDLCPVFGIEEAKATASDLLELAKKTLLKTGKVVLASNYPEGCSFEDGFHLGYNEGFNAYKEQKPAEWSEEDERAINCACVALRAYAHGDLPEFLPSELMGYADRLQSLRLDSYKNCNSRWKPSEEQILAIVEALKYLPNNKDEWMILNTLIDVLRKLM